MPQPLPSTGGGAGRRRGAPRVPRVDSASAPARWPLGRGGAPAASAVSAVSAAVRIRRGAASQPLDPADEPVAARRHGLDVARVPGIVSNRAPELGDDAGERVVGDGGPFPDRVEELLLGNQAIGVVEQVAEHLERLRFELHQLVSPPHPFGREIDAYVTERQEIAGRHHEIISGVG